MPLLVPRWKPFEDQDDLMVLDFDVVDPEDFSTASNGLTSLGLEFESTWLKTCYQRANLFPLVRPAFFQIHCVHFFEFRTRPFLDDASCAGR